jgi:hypothetical protein
VAIVRVGDLEIDQDLGYQRRSWRVQRIGWVAMFAVVAAALAGVLGSGPLSRSTATAAAGLDVEYQRFARYQDPVKLTLRLHPGVTGAERVRVSINREFLDHSRIEGILPQPEAQEAGDDRVVFVFRMAAPGTPMTISYIMSPERVGPLDAVVRVGTGGAGSPAVRFRQWTYP